MEFVITNIFSVPNMIYIVICSLAPMLVITLLSEVQLHKEQFNSTPHPMQSSGGLLDSSSRAPSSDSHQNAMSDHELLIRIITGGIF